MSIEIANPILFVDDNASVRRSFRRSMEPKGFKVELAESGLEAVHKVEKSTYSVVITDLSMPGMDGLTLIDRLQSSNPSTAFIVVTGATGKELHGSMRKEGAVVPVVTKPWRDDELAAAIERAISASEEGGSECSPEKREDKRAKILIVEDDPFDADLVKEFIEQAAPGEYLVHRVGRLGDAVDALQNQDFFMVVADLGLPDASGVDAIEAILTVAPDVPLVVLSGSDDEAIALHAVQVGAQDYLVKNHVDRFSLFRSIRYAAERKKGQQRLTHLAHFDQLTGLSNRVFFQERLLQQLSRAKRLRRKFAVFFLDLDRFKSVNDSLGHGAGDLLLQRASQRLKLAVRDYDIVARLGGDEFAIIVDEPADAEALRAVSDRVLGAFSEPFFLDSHEVFVSASLGIAVYPEAGESSEELLRAADSAMYAAKASGRATSHTFNDESKKKVLSDLLFEQGVRRALEADEFLVYFQPQFDMRRNQVIGFEALIRWRPAGRTVVTPDQFVPVLEDTGLIVEVGAWVFSQACQRLREWEDAGVSGLRLSVNVGTRQFEQWGLSKHVDNALQKFGISPNQLEVEISESILAQHSDSAGRVLGALKELGVRIVVDDFGVGCSCLSHIERCGVDAVKIDRSLVQRIGQRGDGHVLADIVVIIGQKLGVDVVAGGVETRAQAEHLLLQGCHLAQGYYFARPDSDWDVNRLGEFSHESLVPISSLDL